MGSRDGYPILLDLFGTTNVVRGETKLLTPLRRLQTDAERWPDTNVTARALALVKAGNAVAALGRAGQVTADMLKEAEACIMPVLRMPAESAGQEAEALGVLVRYLGVLLPMGQKSPDLQPHDATRFAWFNIKTRLRNLKAQNQTALYNNALSKLKDMPLGEREKKEMDEFLNE